MVKQPRVSQDLNFYLRAGVIGFLVLTACGSLLALISYEPKDGGYTYPHRFPIQNYLGKFGVSMAEFGYQWLGVQVYLVPLFCLLLALGLWKSAQFSWRTAAWIVWGLLAMAWLCAMMSLWETPPLLSGRMPSYGGIVGLFLLVSLRQYLGIGGMYGILLLLTIALITNAVTLWLEQRFLHELTTKPSELSGEGKTSPAKNGYERLYRLRK